jgi:hypothetical protein
MKKTAWFPPHIKPVHEGWYECKCCNSSFWWNGEVWLYDMDSPFKVLFQEIYWRGLTEEAK